MAMAEADKEDKEPFEKQAAPLVSVIIPTYNRHAALERALRTVRAQTHRRLQIIVVNDCSTQPEYYNYRPEGVLLVHLPQNSGRRPGRVRNYGLKLAEGDYIAFLDDDDAWLPTKLEEQLAALGTAGGERMCCTTATELDPGDDCVEAAAPGASAAEEGAAELWPVGHEELPDVLGPEHLRERNVLISTSVLVHRSVVASAGFFSDRCGVCGASAGYRC